MASDGDTRIWNMTLAQFRDAVARRALPGCGAAAASVGVTGLALLLRGLRLNREQSAAVPRLIDSAEQLAQTLGAHADDDIRAFEAYMAAQDSPEAAVDRQVVERINQVPLAIAQVCLDGLVLARAAQVYIHGMPAGDISAGTRMLYTALGSVLISVDVNSEHIDDKDLRRELRQQRHQLLAAAHREMRAFERAEPNPRAG